MSDQIILLFGAGASKGATHECLAPPAFVYQTLKMCLALRGSIRSDQNQFHEECEPQRSPVYTCSCERRQQQHRGNELELQCGL